MNGINNIMRRRDETILETKNIKTIGVLTSGGDAPGMNPAIRSVVRSGIYNGFKVMGIRKGFIGLLNGDIIEMTNRSVSDIINRGGTILQTGRCAELMTLEGQKKAVNMAKVFGIDALVILGGDGSFRGGYDLSKLDMPFIGVPCTIDNDIDSTEYTIGFDTCCNTVQDAIDKIRDTAYSHERCSVVEVMGRNSGQIALNISVACGAEAVIIPEMPYDFNKNIIRPIIEGKNRGKQHYIILLAEGIGGAVEIASQIEEITGISTRATILGYIQRGGSPTPRDRVIASLMGAKATQLLKDGIYNRLVVRSNNMITDVSVEEGLKMKKSLDEFMYEVNNILSL